MHLFVGGENDTRSLGGIMIGFNSSIFIMVEFWEGDFSFSIRLVNNFDRWEQIIKVVYGPNTRE